MWERATPYPVRFPVLNGVGETLQPDRATLTQQPGRMDEFFTDFLLREIFGEEKVRVFLAWCSTVLVDGCGEFTVTGLSVVSHRVSVLEGFSESA